MAFMVDGPFSSFKEDRMSVPPLFPDFDSNSH